MVAILNGQLHITRRKLCYFVIYTSNWITVEKIHYEPEFWASHMAEKLKMFYMDCMLSEIIRPLYPIRMLKFDIKESELCIYVVAGASKY
ncbi:YqaJ domain-containing protein [Aphis craccivora]|uniref:YqaJ domain-containing protein n=1 Tax=Aphis craccivora TaxID=307492 RepID=A0A6G0Y4A8_APHCR|nr:YqaJ domain-containing protein [Aphis craccivora]